MDGVFGPLMNDHIPLPIVGAFPESVVEVMLQRLWSGPALEEVGREYIVI
jgi:hypothetical protein